jgi:flavodoxin
MKLLFFSQGDNQFSKCLATNTQKESEGQEMTNLKEEKCLIAYYSREGNNYVSGNIVNLPIGNTKVVANMIQEMTGGDVFCINTVKSYPEDYTETTNVAKKELHDNARPELSSHVKNMDSYNVIFLGYPNWYGTMPMPVFTFLEEYEFSGKTIIPYCTHEGSGLGHSEKDIAKLCPKATLLKGLSIHGSSVNAAKKDVANWLSKIGMIS